MGGCAGVSEILTPVSRPPAYRSASLGFTMALPDANRFGTIARRCALRKSGATTFPARDMVLLLFQESVCRQSSRHTETQRQQARRFTSQKNNRQTITYVRDLTTTKT